MGDAGPLPGIAKSATCTAETNQPISFHLSTLCRIQQLPVQQLTSAHWIELREALSALRADSSAPSYLRLPDAAWELLDELGVNSGLEPLYARRIIAQSHEHAMQRCGLGPLLVGETLSAARHGKARLGKWLLRSRYHSSYLWLFRYLPNRVNPGFREYEIWRDQAREVSPSRDVLEQASDTWTYKPLISILLATRNTRKAWLEQAIQSVKDQVYPNWELCICDDASTDPDIRDYMKSLPTSDRRISVEFSGERLGESGAFNKAARMASGELIAFLDHDDMLAPEALHYVADALQDKNADVIYTDEDFINEEGVGIRPHFKPDWSPRLLDGCMYLGHLVVIRRSLFEEIGGFRSTMDGAQDFDLALRATERANIVRHIPRVLYHWRMHPNSMAADVNNKPRTHVLGRSALVDAISRRCW